MNLSLEEAQIIAKENLMDFPPGIAEDFLAFANSGDATYLDRVVLGVLQFYLAQPPPKPLMDLAGSTRLMEDLGCDSLTMVDMLFLAEGLFNIKLSDDELARVTTLDDLRVHFRRHLGCGDLVAA